MSGRKLFNHFVLSSWICFYSIGLIGQTMDTPTKTFKVNGIEYPLPTKAINKVYPYDVELKKADGSIANSSTLFTTGKPTILLFWLTTCVPCGYELAAIHKKYASWKQQADFNFYAISIDFQDQEPQFFRRIQTGGWEFEAFLDVDRVFPDIMPGELNGVPQTFVLDKSGKIVYQKKKFTVGDEDTIFDEILILSQN